MLSIQSVVRRVRDYNQAGRIEITNNIDVVIGEAENVAYVEAGPLNDPPALFTVTLTANAVG